MTYFEEQYVKNNRPPFLPGKKRDLRDSSDITIVFLRMDYLMLGQGGCRLEIVGTDWTVPSIFFFLSLFFGWAFTSVRMMPTRDASPTDNFQKIYAIAWTNGYYR